MSVYSHGEVPPFQPQPPQGGHNDEVTRYVPIVSPGDEPSPANASLDQFFYGGTETEAAKASPGVRRFMKSALAFGGLSVLCATGFIVHGFAESSKPDCAVEGTCEQPQWALPQTTDTDENGWGDPTTEPTESASPTPSETPASPSPSPSTSTTPKPAKHTRTHTAGGDAGTLSAATCGVWGDVNHQPLVYQDGSKAAVVVDTRRREHDACVNDGFYDGSRVYNGPSTGSGAKELQTTFTTTNGKVINGSVVRVLGMACNEVTSTQAQNGNAMPSALWLKVQVNDSQAGYIPGTAAGYPDQATLRSMGYVQKYLPGSPVQHGNC